MPKPRRKLDTAAQPMTTWPIPMRTGTDYHLPLLPAPEGQHPQPDWIKLPVCHRCEAGTDPQRRWELNGGILPIMRYTSIRRIGPDGKTESLPYGWVRHVAACSCAAGGARRKCNPGMGWYDDSPAALPGLSFADLSALYVWLVGEISIEDACEELARSQPVVAARVRVAILDHQSHGSMPDLAACAIQDRMLGEGMDHD